jgi:hypothetical protein
LSTGSDWIDKEGADVVRSALEHDTHRSLACLSDGRAALFADEWSCDALIRTGTDAATMDRYTRTTVSASSG